MKLTFPVLAGALISSLMVLTATAQPVPVRDGSNASRAPLPCSRPIDFVRVLRAAPEAGPAEIVLAADHLGARQETKNRATALAAARTRSEQAAAARAVVTARAKAARLAPALQ